MTAVTSAPDVWISSAQWPTTSAAGDAAAELEDLGVGTLWLGSADPSLALPERLLRATRRMRVATGIVNLWTADPDALAARRAELDEDFGDRFVLGLGMAHAANVETTGQRYVRPYAKLVDYLDRLDAAPRPVPAAGRVLAALGPRAIALAGERTAGAHPYLTTPEHTAQARSILGPGPLLVPEQKVVLDPDPSAARATAREAVRYYLQLPNYTRNLARHGFTADDLAGAGSDRLIDALVAQGDEQAAVRRVEAHRAAGADAVAVQIVTATGRQGPLPLPELRRLLPALTEAGQDTRCSSRT